MGAESSHGTVNVEADGPGIVVNGLRYGHQAWPDIAVVAPHEAIVVWSGPHAESTRGGGVWARFLSDTGPTSEELLLDPTHTSFPTLYPRVAHAADGSSAVIYQAEAGNRGDDGGVFLRTLDTDGTTADGGEMQVHADATGYQSPGDVAAGDDGSYLVAWYNRTPLLSDATLVVRRFDTSGKPMSDELPVAQGSLYSMLQTLPIAALPGGRYVVAWSSLGVVQVSWIAQDGSLSEPRILASGTPTAQPSVMACEDGRHLVVWSTPDGGGTDLLGQWLDAAGNDLGPVRVIVRSPQPWGGYDTPIAAMTPGCTGLLEFQYRMFLATPDGSNATNAFMDGFAALAAESDRRFVRIRSIGNALDEDVEAQWYCLMRDEDAVCGDATCVGDADATGHDRINVRDAMRVLRSAVGLDQCAACRCDTDGSGKTTVSDAVRVLMVSVGNDVPLSCPACAAGER